MLFESASQIRNDEHNRRSQLLLAQGNLSLFRYFSLSLLAERGMTRANHLHLGQCLRVVGLRITSPTTTATLKASEDFLDRTIEKATLFSCWKTWLMLDILDRNT